MLAHDQAERIRERGFGTVARLAEAARIAARFKTGREIGGNAFHRECADRFDAGLFRRFEDRGGIGRLRTQLFVQEIFVIGATQSIGVARAAHDRNFGRRQIARGQGQARLQTLERGRLGAEIRLRVPVRPQASAPRRRRRA